MPSPGQLLLNTSRWLGRFGHLRSSLLFAAGALIGAMGGLVVTGVGGITQWIHHALFLLPDGAKLSEQQALSDWRLALIPAAGGW